MAGPQPPPDDPRPPEAPQRGGAGGQAPAPAWSPPPPPGYSPGLPGYPPPPPPVWQPPVDLGPGNDVAVAGFVLAVGGGVLLLFSSGIAAPVSLILAILGIIFSRKGKAKIAGGETRRHAGLAQAGFIVGIVALVLSVLAALFWIGIIVVAIVSESSQSSGDPGPFDPRNTISMAVRLVLAAD